MHNYHVSMYTELSSLLLAFYVPQDRFAATPLIAACDENKLEVAEFLIQKGANMDLQNKVISTLYCFHNLFTKLNIFSQNLGEASLHIACKNGYTKIAKLLIESGAMLEITTHVSVEVLVAYMGMGS